jgi:hypothetical protein
MIGDVTLVASGDSRLAANQMGWAAQTDLESALARALGLFGKRIERGHTFDAAKGHGFIDSQRRRTPCSSANMPTPAVAASSCLASLSRCSLGRPC